MIQHVDVQFALVGQTRQRQIAAAQVADDRVDPVGAKEQVELGVKSVAEKQLDANFLGLDLACQPAQPGFVLVGGCAEGELRTKFLG